MKGAIGFLFFMLFLAGFALVLLQGRQTAESNLGQGAARWVGVEWQPTSISETSLPAQTTLRVRFGAEGRVTGHAGCNDFSGALARTDGGIEIGPLQTTRKACAPETMQREHALLGALERTASVEAGANSLRLLSEVGAVLAELRSARE